MRQAVVARIDPAKAIAYFGRTQGWTPTMVRQQVLTPLEEAGLAPASAADETSIMCYQLPGSIMRDGRPVLGGSVITPTDAATMARAYPKPAGPAPTDPGGVIVINLGPKTVTLPAGFKLG